MEGVARRRREAGLPGARDRLGADHRCRRAGAFARRLRVAVPEIDGGARHAGARGPGPHGASARAADSAPELAVITISPTEDVFTADRLPVLGSPTYAAMLSAAGARQRSGGRASICTPCRAAEGLKQSARALTDVIVAELARVLHAREDEISRVRPLGEIGLDSLMALEFAMNLEASSASMCRLPSAMGNLTVSGLANEIICSSTCDAAHNSARRQ